ncbi:MAG: glycosyltransferase family 4 protein, partial [Gammaproteobacteria bacterium]|nr:glycosyltransferase family 4 protein [Gammaproteobacteria bacterium]
AALGSRSAFHFLINRLYSEMVRHWGKEGFRVYIAGLRDLPAWAARAINKRPEFIFLGFVDDLDGLMAASDAIIAPIDVSVGNRSRIVTAMAKSALVIAHRNTALGNPSLVDGETCYLAVTPGEFSEAMVRAVAGGPDITEIIQRAKQSYEAEFAPDVASQMLIDSLSMAYNEWRLA